MRSVALSNPDETQFARLRWKCRRGMLELDLMLLRFLEQGYPRLTPEERAAFDALLDEEDPTLQRWFTRQAIPEREDFARIVQLILSRDARAT